MAVRKQTDEAKATRAFGTLTRIKKRREDADGVLGRARQRHADSMTKLDADESEARKALASYGFVANTLAEEEASGQDEEDAPA